MRVTKRSGRIEDMKFDSITNRIKNLTYGLSETCDSTKVAQQVFSSLYDGITTQEIDTLSAEICVGMITSDPDYETLATRIIASNIQKVCPNNFHIAMKKLQKAGIVTEEVTDVALKVKDDIKTERDFEFGYFGIKTLEKSYLQRMEGKIIENPSIHVYEGLYRYSRHLHPRCFRDLRQNVPRLLHSRHPNTLQFWDTPSTNEFLLPYR